VTIIRYVKSVTDDDIAAAVHTARAVVRLAETCETLGHKVTELEQKVQEERGYQQSAGQERRRLLDRIGAVRDLHHEAEEVVCGDGCCHQGLGHCDYDNEPYPCATIRAVDGAAAEV
jgi:hypothetical protein